MRIERAEPVCGVTAGEKHTIVLFFFLASFEHLPMRSIRVERTAAEREFNRVHYSARRARRSVSAPTSVKAASRRNAFRREEGREKSARPRRSGNEAASHAAPFALPRLILTTARPTSEDKGRRRRRRLSDRLAACTLLFALGATGLGVALLYERYSRLIDDGWHPIGARLEGKVLEVARKLKLVDDDDDGALGSQSRCVRATNVEIGSMEVDVTYMESTHTLVASARGCQSSGLVLLSSATLHYEENGHLFDAQRAIMDFDAIWDDSSSLPKMTGQTDAGANDIMPAFRVRLRIDRVGGELSIGGERSWRAFPMLRQHDECACGHRPMYRSVLSETCVTLSCTLVEGDGRLIDRDWRSPARAVSKDALVVFSREAGVVAALPFGALPGYTAFSPSVVHTRAPVVRCGFHLDPFSQVTRDHSFEIEAYGLRISCSAPASTCVIHGTTRLFLALRRTNTDTVVVMADATEHVGLRDIFEVDVLWDPAEAPLHTISASDFIEFTHHNVFRVCHHPLYYGRGRGVSFDAPYMFDTQSHDPSQPCFHPNITRLPPRLLAEATLRGMPPSLSRRRPC